MDANASRCGREMSLSSRARYARLALQLDPRHPRALANSGRVAYLLGDCVQAQTDWSAALALDPADQWTAFWRFWASGASVAQLPADLPADRLASQVYSWGWRAEGAGATNSALIWYRLSFDLYPGVLAASRLLALDSDLQSREARLATWKRLTVHRDEGQADYWWAKGRIAALLGDWEHAASAYDRGVSPRDITL